MTHHKLEGKEGTIGMRSTLEYLDNLLGVNREGIDQLPQSFVLLDLGENHQVHPRQGTLSLFKKLPRKLVGGESHRHTICRRVVWNFVQGSSRNVGGFYKKMNWKRLLIKERIHKSKNRQRCIKRAYHVEPKKTDEGAHPFQLPELPPLLASPSVCPAPLSGSRPPGEPWQPF